MSRGIKKKSRPEPGYGLYIHKVMKQTHPALSVSRGSIETVNSMLEVLVKNLTQQSIKVAATAKKNTLSARHVQAACRICLPGELSGQAISEGTKALTKFTAA
jgi:histone H2B